MTVRSLKFAGWLAMASAFLTLPLVYFSYLLESRTDVVAGFLQASIQISGTCLFVAIVLYLRRLLNRVFKFHDADRIINLLVLSSIVIGVLSMGTLFVSPLKESLESAVIVMLIVQGMVQVQFGYKLLRLPYDLGGMLKPFCYANMATGIMLASVLLIPLGIVISAISDLMLGTIFFNISRLAMEDDSERA